MRWTAKAVDPDHDRFVVWGDNDAVGIASISEQRIIVLHVVKYAPLGHGTWLPVTADDRRAFTAALPDMSVVDSVTGELVE